MEKGWECVGSGGGGIGLFLSLAGPFEYGSKREWNRLVLGGGHWAMTLAFRSRPVCIEKEKERMGAGGGESGDLGGLRVLKQKV